MLIRDIKVQLNFVVLFTRNEDPPPHGVRTPADVAENGHISGGCVIVENLFGRLCVF